MATSTSLILEMTEYKSYRKTDCWLGCAKNNLKQLDYKSTYITHVMLTRFRTYRTLNGFMAVLLLASSMLPLVRYVCPMTGQTTVLASLADQHPCDEEETTSLDSVLCPNGHVKDACPSCVESEDCCCQKDAFNHKQATLTVGKITFLGNDSLPTGLAHAFLPSIQPVFFSDYTSHLTSQHKAPRGPSVSLRVLFSSYLI